MVSNLFDDSGSCAVGVVGVGRGEIAPITAWLSLLQPCAALVVVLLISCCFIQVEHVRAKKSFC